MGQVANLCSGDVFKELQEKYGETFVKVMVAEKSKEVVGEEFQKLNAKADETFQGFTDKATNIVDEKNKALNTIFEDLKSKVNNTIPGGIPALERLKGQSINDFSGFNSLQGQISSVKTQALNRIQEEKGVLQGQFTAKKTEMISQIDQQRPRIELYDELPDPVKTVVRNKAEEVFADQIGQNKNAIIDSIGKQFNLNNLEGLFQKISPEATLNGIVGSATSQISNALGLGGGVGQLINGGLSFLKR